MPTEQKYKMTRLTDIRPYDRNPRIIPQAAIDAVARSIQEYGFRSPIVVDADGVILAGHTRYKAAQQLGLEEVPVVWQSDITAIQARGYRIADNKVAEISTWDRDALDAEVRDIAATADADLEALGLADWELDRILHDCGMSPGGALKQLEAELFNEQSRGSSAATCFGAAPNDSGAASSVCENPCKTKRVLVTIPPSDIATEDAVTEFLESLTETLSRFPGGKAEIF